MNNFVLLKLRIEASHHVPVARVHLSSVQLMELQLLMEFLLVVTNAQLLATHRLYSWKLEAQIWPHLLRQPWQRQRSQQPFHSPVHVDFLAMCLFSGRKNRAKSGSKIKIPQFCDLETFKNKLTSTFVAPSTLVSRCSTVISAVRTFWTLGLTEESIVQRFLTLTFTMTLLVSPTITTLARNIHQ